MFPKSILDEIDRVRRQYLWDGNSSSKKRALVNWDLVCKPKKFGGLGLKNLQLWNTTALGVAYMESCS